jgi:type II secretory pathway pseudopilin PulG
MAVLLIGMSVAAVLMTVAMPVWKQMTRREQEAELVFRGQQYVRAIGLFQRRAGPGALPPSVDALVQGKFLRRKYKDPITGQDFDLISPVQTPAAGQQPGQQGGFSTGRGAQPSTAAPGQGSIVSPQPGTPAGGGGIIGVASKSKEASIRIYNGRTHYNEWQFVFVQQTQQPGTPGLPARGGGGGNPEAGGGVGGVGGGRGRGQGPGGQGQGRGGNQGPPPFPQGGGRGFQPPVTAPQRPPG